MALTTNVPSDRFEDLQRDVQDATRFPNATAEYQNRIGQTITPLPLLQEQINASIQATGWFAAAGSFEAGGTITARNQYLQLVTTVGDDVAGGYTWGGTLPKVVAPGSTPATTGGTPTDGTGWVYRSDTTLRSLLGVLEIGVSNLKQLDGVELIDGAAYRVSSFYDPSVHGVGATAPAAMNMGGTTFAYRADIAKTFNNGGTILSPESIAAWDGTIGDIATLAADAGAGNGVFVSLDYQKPYLEMFGLVHNQDVDNTPVVRNGLDAHRAVYVGEGIFRMKTPVGKSYTQRSIIGKEPQTQQKRNIIFSMTTPDLGEGVVWFAPSNLTTQVQSITINNITFQGDGLGSAADLSLLTDTGVIPLDISGIKEQTDLSGCCFRRVKRGFINGNFGYTDLVNLDKTHFQLCYSPVEMDNTLVGPINANGCMIFDCADWGTWEKVHAKGAWFNNSNFSSDSCSAKGTLGVFEGCWFEGGQNRLDFRRLYLNCNQDSEAYASNPAQKCHIIVRDGDNITVDICRLGTNTRLFNMSNVTDYSTVTLDLNLNYNGSSFELNTGSFDSFVTGVGQEVNIKANCPAIGWLHDSEKIRRVFGTIRTVGALGVVTGDTIISHQRNARTVIGTTKSFRVVVGRPNDYNSLTRVYHYIRILLISSDDGAGGNSRFTKEFILSKGSAASAWGVTDTIASASWTVVLANADHTGVDVTITAAHAGNTTNDLMFVCESSDSLSVSFL